MTDQPEAQPETAEGLTRRLLERGEMVHPDPDHPGLGVRMIATATVREAVLQIEAAGFREGAAEGAARLRTEMYALISAEVIAGSAGDWMRFEDKVNAAFDRVLAASPEAREPGISVEPKR